MAALGQVHAHDGVADVQQRKVDGQVGLCAGVRLDVGILRAEQLAGAVNGDLLDLIDVLAAAVITVAGVPFRVLVRQHAAHGRHDGGGNDVLAGNQLNVLPLAAQLTLHSRAQLGVVALHKADGVDDVLVHTAFPPNIYAVHGGRIQDAPLQGAQGRIPYPPAAVPAAEHLPYSVPLVDKTPSIRASLRVAASSALANALNMASSLWWSFSP